LKKEAVHVRKLALLTIFSALGIALSPFLGFPALGSVAYPAQHMINAILGVLLGPFWAVVAAIIIGTARNMLGVGSLYAFPGGIPGGIVVGSAYWILKHLKRTEKTRLISALTEPIGTLLVGVPISVFIFATWVRSIYPALKPIADSATFAALWALSCIPGCIMGFAILVILNRIGISRETLFGEE
jgi:energy coupling factor transporter S component ThiW